MMRMRQATAKYEHAIKDKIKMIKQAYWHILKIIFFQIKFGNVSLAEI